MSENSVIIIGAGASGCMAAREMLKAGREVLVLEAKGKAGGRIQTSYHRSLILESGAEFVHGNLPVTMELLNEFKIGCFHSGGKMVHIEKGKVKRQPDFFEGWNQMLDEMSKLEVDMTFDHFLSTHFQDEKYAGLRNSAKRFAEGFDVADIREVSTKALYKEWREEDDDGQYRIDGGYQKLIDAMADDCRKRGGSFLFNQKVNHIGWKKNRVEVSTEEGMQFQGTKIIITVPIGVLRLKPEEGGIRFFPEIESIITLTKLIGYGSVIKFLVEFKEPLWERIGSGIGFFFVEELIPTWWTQAPRKDLLLTGWVGGPNAKKLENQSDASLKQCAMDVLKHAFSLEDSSLKKVIENIHVFNWGADPLIRGAYSFPGIHTGRARKELSKPVDGTLFLAGEGFFEGDMGGTVEAALINGRDVALDLLKTF
ncbi:MAG: hypothetical protein C5B59_08955 [Bacteroidetes bacterium]|nr:MAG: hypothetical protein C5B59_08955 [Bacteroidota bacterium]